MKWVKAAFLVLVSAVFLFPLYWMLIGSVTPMVGIMKMPPDAFPAHPTLENYRDALNQGVVVLRWLANSVVITVCTVALALVVNGGAAYALTVYRFGWTRAVYLAFAATMMLSRYALFIPMFKLLHIYHLHGILAVVLTGVFYPLGFFLLYNFMRMIPRDFVESARMDGAGEFRIFSKIMLPLCKPALGAVMAFKAMDSFGDYIWQNLVLQGEREHSYVVGMMANAYRTIIYTRLNNYGLMMAVGILMFLPLLIIFLWTNRYFIEGITLGGVKE